MSAWPRHSSPRQRHCTVTTLVSMETAMSMSTSALKSIGVVPGLRFLPLGWGTSNLCRLCPSVRFSCEKHNMCTRAVVVSSRVVCVSFVCFFPSLVIQEPKQNLPMFFQMGTVASRSPSDSLPWSRFLPLSLVPPPPTPLTQACGVGISGLNGRLCGSLRLFRSHRFG